MYNLAQAGFTEAQVTAALRTNRTVSYGYELLDKNDSTIGEIQVASCRIYNNSEATIQRTIQLVTQNDSAIDYASDRIRPYMKLKMGDTFLTFPLGIFLMSSPTRKEQSGSIQRTIEGYDKMQILADDKFTSRYAVAANTTYTGAVATILQSAGITKYNIEQTAKETQTILEWPVGTSKLTACNDLLQAINYVPLYADAYGYIRSAPYALPEARGIDAGYTTDKDSVVLYGGEEELDIFGAPNKIVRYLENAERQYLESTAVNTDPNSKLSTVSRGRTIVDVASVSDIADQASLDAYVARIMAERKVYQNIIFDTLNMPNHENNDCLYVDYGPLGASGKFIETAWEMDLAIGGRMRHICRKAVSI